MPRMRRDRPHVSADKDLKLLTVIAVVIPASFLPVIAYHLGGGQDAGWNPIGVLLSVGMGKRSWPATATAVLILEVVLIAVLVVGGWWGLRQAGVIEKAEDKRAEKRLDTLAASMTDPRDVEETDPRALAATTARIAPMISESHAGHGGIVMGRTVVGNRELRMPWEWVCVAIAGARMGKSQALAIPAACYAPGALIATSNKKDIYTHTLYPRKRTGRVWLFDLQGVTSGNKGERASFWFNPLRQVADLPSAKVVGDYFVSAATDEGARVDAYFDGNARDLFGSYILAATLAGGDMRHVVEWLTNTQSQIPTAVLEQLGYPDLAATMRGKQQVNAKQRDGFYDMARRFLAPLDEPRFAEAVLPNTRIKIGLDSAGGVMTSPGRQVHELPEFDAAQFVRSTDTVYAMSLEGPGSASALTMALIGSILDCAQDYGAGRPSGRIPIPLVAVLDEAANICRLQQLPDWYSHFGSRGIIPITILQSPSQGKAVWGETRFGAMLDACNLLWYGGNVSDEGFINSLSNAIGDHHVLTESRSHGTGLLGGSGQSTVQQSWQKEKILEPSDLKALPKTRAIVSIAGSKPLLVRKTYWSMTPFADDIERSLAECERDADRPEHKALPVGVSDRPIDVDLADEHTVRPADHARADTLGPGTAEPVPPPRPPVPAPRTPRGVDGILDSEFFTEGAN